MNIEEAIRLYRLSSEQGNANAMLRLGYLYQHGIEGILEKNMIEAIRYYQLASKQNDSGALYNLAVCYENGNGIDKNIDEAIRIYKLLAIKNYPIAIKALDRLGVNK